MEKLLNKLIEKGWKPFWWKDIKRINNEWWFVCFVHKSKKRPWLSEVSHRELVSIESWLWQFVCENGMVKWIWSEIEIKNLNEWYWVVRDTNYQYRVLVSALCDEDKLEEFLLDNIKI